MSEFNFDEPEPKSSGFSMPAIGLWDILTILVLLVTVCLGAYFIAVFINPASSMNMLQPVWTPTPTITPRQLEATWTPTATVYVPPTATLLPSITPPATLTPANFIPPTVTSESTVPPTATSTPKAPFSVSSVNSIESIIIPHLLNAGCDWQGVGGTVDDQNSSPIIGIVVRLAGSYDGKSVELTTISGISPEYGKSGFEFVLGDTPIDSNDRIYVQLLDQAGLPLSEEIRIDTSSDCKENLVLVRFKKNR
ncbi:MAG: hypothetical protein PVJ21_01760 [Anaerolineales bacterium]|jgi:hypothetical protein